jgi:hypothetical protein
MLSGVKYSASAMVSGITKSQKPSMAIKKQHIEWLGYVELPLNALLNFQKTSLWRQALKG